MNGVNLPLAMLFHESDPDGDVPTFCGADRSFELAAIIFDTSAIPARSFVVE